ncbi:MAG: hypothetical protein WD768_21465 [Phycisphaeraceae bacterium]
MHRLCLLLVALMALTACAENQVAVTTQDAREKFLTSVELVQLVQLVYTPTTKRTERLTAMNKYQSFGLDTLPPDAKTAITQAKDYESYRAAVLAAATTQLKSLLTQGPTSQQVSAHHLLAQIETLQSSVLRRDAILAGDKLANEAAILVATTRNIDRALAMARQYNTDDAAIVAKLQEDKTKVDAELASLEQQVTTLKGELATQNGLITEFEKIRDDAFKKASGLRAQAFTLKGQEQYDLHIAAIESDREGYAADRKVADATVARNQIFTPMREVEMVDPDTQRKTKVTIPPFGKLVIAEADLAMYEAWSKGILSAMSDSGSRKATLANVQSAVNKRVDETISGRFMPAFRTVAKSYKESIEGPIDSSIAHAGEAVTLANAAEKKAPAESKTEAKMWMLDANVEKLSALADGMICTSTIGGMLKSVLVRGDKMLGSEATELKDLVAALETKNAAYHTEAVTILSNVKTLYGDAMLSNFTGESPLELARAARIKSVKTLVATITDKLSKHALGGSAAAGTGAE